MTSLTGNNNQKVMNGFLNFDGSGSQGRNVNYSGRKGARSRNDFLNQKNKDREKREKIRQRQTSSNVIQERY